VRPAAYPHMLLTAGLNDSRVAYWEIAKFAQRLRAANTGGSQILCKVRGGVRGGGGA
jgi:oligopeptidase B